MPSLPTCHVSLVGRSYKIFRYGFFFGMRISNCIVQTTNIIILLFRGLNLDYVGKCPAVQEGEIQQL